jgi:hypothetical protein
MVKLESWQKQAQMVRKRCQQVEKWIDQRPTTLEAGGEEGPDLEEEADSLLAGFQSLQLINVH